MQEVSVIMYHYVRDLKSSRYPEIKGLEIYSFLKQIQFFKSKYHFISIEELIDAVYGNNILPKNSVLLTFDDGYKDHYENVFPILLENKIKAAFYVPAKVVKERKALDVNKIHFILASAKNKVELVHEIKKYLKSNFSIDSTKFDYYYKKLAIPNRLDDKDIVFVKSLLQFELDKKTRNQVVDFLFSKYINESEESFSDSLYMDLKNLKEIQKYGMHVGCHGYDHFWWSKLNSEELKKELNLSLDFLIDDVGVNKNTLTVAYPYGSFNNIIERKLDYLNFKLGFTTVSGAAKINYRNKLKLKRFDTIDFQQT